MLNFCILRISSNEFTDAICNLISSNENVDKESVRGVLKSFRVLWQENITTEVHDQRIGKVVSGRRLQKKFSCVKSKEVIKVFARNDQKETDDFYFYLAECILESLLPLSKSLESLHGIRLAKFGFTISKLLKSESFSEYSQIISSHESISFFQHLND